MYFVYSVLQDPVTPSVMKEAWDVAKLKYFGYINKFGGKQGAENGDIQADRQTFDRAMGGHGHQGPDLEGSGPVEDNDNVLHRM